VSADAGVATLLISGTGVCSSPTGGNIPIDRVDCDVSALPAGH